MAKRFTDSDKYKKKFIRSLPAAYKIFWDYLYHDCTFAGIWEVDFEVAQIRVGSDAPINPKEALRLFNNGEERIRVVNGGSKWIVLPFVTFQYGQLNPLNKVHAAVLKELSPFTPAPCKPHASPMQAHKDKDMDKEKDKDTVNKGLDLGVELKNLKLLHPTKQGLPLVRRLLLNMGFAEIEIDKEMGRF